MYCKCSAKIFAKKLAKSNPNPTQKRVRKIRVAEGVDTVIPEKEAPTNSTDPNTTDTNPNEAEFEKDLVGIYAGPIGKVKDVAKENKANDASMDDAPLNEAPSKDDSSKDV